MIQIKPSPTADTRSCDWSKVTKDQLIQSSKEHISDVRNGLIFLMDKMVASANVHDFDKISDIDEFYGDFQTGFERTVWWDNHRLVNRHHLLVEDGVPEDVNLIDVLEMIVDCVVAGMARSGNVYPLVIPPEVLNKAFSNTVKLMKSNVEVIDG